MAIQKGVFFQVLAPLFLRNILRELESSGASPRTLLPWGLGFVSCFVGEAQRGNFLGDDRGESTFT